MRTEKFEHDIKLLVELGVYSEEEAKQAIPGNVTLTPLSEPLPTDGVEGDSTFVPFIVLQQVFAKAQSMPEVAEILKLEGREFMLQSNLYGAVLETHSSSGTFECFDKYQASKHG